ncbi:hypothetical protein D3C72_2200230 [compost metagenome]
MDIYVAVKVVDQLCIVRKYSCKTQLKLRVISTDKYLVAVRNKCFANLATKLGAYRNILKVWICRR